MLLTNQRMFNPGVQSSNVASGISAIEDTNARDFGALSCLSHSGRPLPRRAHPAQSVAAGQSSREFAVLIFLDLLERYAIHGDANDELMRVDEEDAEE